MSKITFLQLAQKVLAETAKSMSSEEIWDYALDKGYTSQLSTTGKTPRATLGARLYVLTRDSPDADIKATGQRPKRFYLSAHEKNISEFETSKLETSTAKAQSAFLEKDLHPFIAYYAATYLSTYCKTISHSKSEKSKWGEWIHPDMVGCYFPMKTFEKSTIELSDALGVSNARLLSFELKKALNFSNLRESFFQAVSNSSWANEAYLCAAHISSEPEFHEELKRLSGSFGIGIILIEVEDPDSTEIVFPAKYRESLDWEGINKLCVNPDFRDFITRIKTDLSTKEIRVEKYDKVCFPEDLVEAIKSKRN